MRPNRVDRLILRGRDPFKPVYLLRFERLRWACLIGFVVVVMGVGFLLRVQQQQQDTACRDRNTLERQYRDTFREMAALERDEDRYPVPTPGAQAFREARARLFLERAEGGPLPPC